MPLRIVGIYQVNTVDACHIIELEASQWDTELNLMEITQEVEGSPRLDWQVPYDERFLSANGDPLQDTDEIDVQPQTDCFRLAFFFHCLDLNKPLLTPAGPLDLPKASPLPERLASMEYIPP
jgi:hypothetical protein